MNLDESVDIVIYGLRDTFALLRKLESGAEPGDLGDICLLQDTVKRVWRLVAILRHEDEELLSQELYRIEVAERELGYWGVVCKLREGKEPLIDALTPWYVTDNFGKSAYSRLVPLMR